MQNSASPAFHRSSDSLARRWANCQISRINILHSSSSRPEKVNGGCGGDDDAVCGGGGGGLLLNTEPDEMEGERDEDISSLVLLPKTLRKKDFRSFPWEMVDILPQRELGNGMLECWWLT